MIGPDLFQIFRDHDSARRLECTRPEVVTFLLILTSKLTIVSGMVNCTSFAMFNL